MQVNLMTVSRDNSSEMQDLTNAEIVVDSHIYGLPVTRADYNGSSWCSSKLYYILQDTPIPFVQVPS